MIVEATPRLKQAAIEVWKPLTALFVWDVLVVIFYFNSTVKIPQLPVALLGSALALFLGFRTNAAYARWWEARGLWGTLINLSRSLARVTLSLTKGSSAADEKLREGVILRQIAYAHALRCRLRGQDQRSEIARLAGEPTAAGAVARLHSPNALQEEISALFANALAEKRIDPMQQMLVEGILTDIANCQGGMERIKNTPLPQGFRLFPTLFTRLFCVLLPIATVETLELATPIGSTLLGMVFLAALSIGDDLTDPFANTVHDVAMSAMSRTIEIDLLQSLGRPAPEPLKPDHGVLW
jgi:ion channel-forming bestrophin family protein